MAKEARAKLVQKYENHVLCVNWMFTCTVEVDKAVRAGLDVS